MPALLLPFEIIIPANCIQHPLTVIHIYQRFSRGQFVVKNSNERWVFEARKPIITSLRSKKFPYRWKLIEGYILHQRCQAAIIKEMEKYLHARQNK